MEKYPKRNLPQGKGTHHFQSIEQVGQGKNPLDVPLTLHHNIRHFSQQFFNG